MLHEVLDIGLLKTIYFIDAVPGVAEQRPETVFPLSSQTLQMAGHFTTIPSAPYK